jgi:hypothetical protein
MGSDGMGDGGGQFAGNRDRGRGREGAEDRGRDNGAEGLEVESEDRQSPALDEGRSAGQEDSSR